jgi:hypothetical protein
MIGVSQFRGLMAKRQVLRTLVERDLRVRYAGSVLGYVWTLLKPLAIFSVLYVVFGRFFKLTVGFEHYPLYLLTGLVLWYFFVDATRVSMPSLADVDLHGRPGSRRPRQRDRDRAPVRPLRTRRAAPPARLRNAGRRLLGRASGKPWLRRANAALTAGSRLTLWTAKSFRIAARKR